VESACTLKQICSDYCGTGLYKLKMTFEGAGCTSTVLEDTFKLSCSAETTQKC